MLYFSSKWLFIALTKNTVLMPLSNIYFIYTDGLKFLTSVNDRRNTTLFPSAFRYPFQPVCDDL